MGRVTFGADPGAVQVAALALAFLALACGGGDVPLPDLTPVAFEDNAVLVARGEYIVRNQAVCGHCHAADPHDPDGPLSGGFAFSNWRVGTVRAANLTPDSATGLGAWTDAEIVRAVRSGEDRRGALLAPIMPYAWYHGISDRDALAVARYLQTLAPVRNDVDNDTNLIYALAKFFFLGPKEGPRDPAPPPGVTPEYGRYLAHHVALCADCHTPRSGLQAQPALDRLLAGDADPPEGFPANPANLTPDSATGIGRWTEADFLRALRTGVDPAGDSLHAFMPWRQFRRMSEDDLRAIWRYLRTIEPILNHVPHRHEGPDGHAHDGES